MHWALRTSLVPSTVIKKRNKDTKISNMFFMGWRSNTHVREVNILHALFVSDLHNLPVVTIVFYQVYDSLGYCCGSEIKRGSSQVLRFISYIYELWGTIVGELVFSMLHNQNIER